MSENSINNNSPRTLGGLRTEAARFLETLDKKLIPVPLREVDILILDLLDLADQDWSYLLLHENDLIDDFDAVLTKLKKLIKRRSQGEPIAYLVGYKDFYGRKFIVNKDVLIPRPETEVAIDIIKSIKPQQILEIGTGSGIIAISGKLELGKAEVLACDKSPEALKVAKKNAKVLAAEVEFVESDLMSSSRVVEFAKRADQLLIVANLPYVDTDWDWLDKTSLDFEPGMALYADDKGLKLIYDLIDQIVQLDIHATVVLESDTSQQFAIRKYAETSGLTYVDTIGFQTVLKI